TPRCFRVSARRWPGGSASAWHAPAPRARIPPETSSSRSPPPTLADSPAATATAPRRCRGSASPRFSPHTPGREAERVRNPVEAPPSQRKTAVMPARRYVSLDPDGMAGGTGWLHVVVRAQTGVIYQQQYGGTACRQGQVEGFLVPVFGPKGLSQLRELFEEH